MAYIRKTADIITSNELDYVLLQIKDQSEVAKLLLKQRHQLECLVDCPINYISISNSDKTKISYLTQERIDKLLSVGEDLWTSNKRYHIKPGSFVGKLFKGIALDEIQKFSILFRNVQSKTNIHFKVIYGPNIRHYYHHDSYSRESGSLGSSCMKYDVCQDYLDLYVHNSHIIKMLVALDDDNKLIGRALLWDDGKTKIMDRIYTIDDDTYQFTLKQWADNNGYWYKREQRWNNTLYFETKGKVMFEKIEFQLDKFVFNNYPYLDTFKFIDLSTGKIYNHQPKGVQIKTISSAEGKIQPGDIYTFCEKSKLLFSNDSIVYVQNRNMSVGIDYVVYSGIYDTHILREDALYDQDVNDWIYQDDDLNNDILLNQAKKDKKNRSMWEDLVIYDLPNFDFESTIDPQLSPL